MNGAGKTVNKNSDSNTSPGLHTQTKRCHGCRKTRSIAQYKGDNTLCIRCDNRRPK